jgi:Glycosyl transferase family 2
MQKKLYPQKEGENEKKPILTIGIPTYDRSDHLNARLLDLEKMGYLSHPEVQIIIHDNDSEEKTHCRKIKNLQKFVKNLLLIESAPNIGMVKGCYKILVAATGTWITLLGDDDPIVMKCSNFLELIKKSKYRDHLYFKTKVYEKGEINEISWFPKLKIGSYDTLELCAKAGFTTHFAFLGSHCFRNKKGIAGKWMKSHGRCMFYGHCIMLLEHYRNSYYTGKTVAAWTSGNERISAQLNIWRHLELRNLFKYPSSKAIREFTDQKPWEVVKQGRFPLIDHITHPVVKFVNDYEQLPKNYRITLNKVSTILMNPLGKILIWTNGKSKIEGDSCVFTFDSHGKTMSHGGAIVFSLGPLVQTSEIIRIIGKLHLRGPIFFNGTKASEVSLLMGCPQQRSISRRISELAFFMYNILLYGVERLDRRQIIINHFTRPRKGLYKVVNALETAIRKTAKVFLSPKQYYTAKKLLFGEKHFLQREKMDSVLPRSQIKSS